MITCSWPDPPKHPIGCPFITRQVAFLREAAVDVDVFYFRGYRNPANYTKAWIRFQNRLAAGDYDLIHAQFGQSGLIAYPKRIPLVVTFRGDDLLGVLAESDGRLTPFGRVSQWLCRMVARRADAAIVVSEHMKAYVPGSTPVHVIPSGLDFDLFRCIPRDEARSRLGLPLNERLVLFAGRPTLARKRYELAKKAVEVLNQTLPTRLIVAWGIQHTEMPYYMNACDALVFVSMQEGSPNVVKESLACNLPVVSVPVGDVRDRLYGIDGCELCADDQPQTIAGSLERVLRRGARTQSREMVRYLDENLQTQKVIGIYESVLRRSAQQRAIA
jgi:glycosyltransferase involved in cell wall biosynthesis